MFNLPEGYSCIVPASATSDTTLYAYKSRQRDTYDLIGFDWVKTRQVDYTYNVDLSGYFCLDSTTVVPSSIKAQFILPASLFVLAFFAIILKMFMGVRR